MDKIKQFFTGNREPAYSEKLNTQLLLAARAIVGGYVLYLAYGLKDAVKTAESSARLALFLTVVVVFSIAGAFLLFISLRDFIIGRYRGGKLDLGDEPDAAHISENMEIPEESYDVKSDET